eukprot:2607171-Pleurochrysis_carterae.AAC.1
MGASADFAMCDEPETAESCAEMEGEISEVATQATGAAPDDEDDDIPWITPSNLKKVALSSSFLWVAFLPLFSGRLSLPFFSGHGTCGK